MKYNSIYNNFSSGELSRYLKGRTDLDEYFKGLEDMSNFLPIKQGGAALRPGTFISESYFGTDIEEPWALFPFTPRDSEPYIVALYPSNFTGTGGGIRVLRVDGSTPAVISYDYCWNRRYNFNDPVSKYDRATDPDPSIILEKLQVIQNGDILFIFDGTGRLAPIVIIRTANNSFVVDSMLGPQQINPATGVPYLSSPTYTYMRTPFTDVNVNTNLRLQNSVMNFGQTGTITATNGAGAPIDFFTGDVVGMHVKIAQTNSGATLQTGVGLITSKVSDSVVNFFVIVAFGSTGVSSNFETSMWNARDGYPTTAAFFEGRMVCGGSPKYIDSVWCSYTGNIYHFTQRRLPQDMLDPVLEVSGSNFFGPITPADPFSFVPASTAANNIQWMLATDTLLIGTTATEFSITSGSENAFGLDSFFVKSISSHGSAKIQPIKVGSAVLFVSADGKRLLEIPKKLSDYLGAVEISSLSEGIIDKAIKEALGSNEHSKVKNKIFKMVWQENESILWLLCKNSDLGGNAIISLTYDKTAKVIGWSKHNIALSSDISSMCVVPDETKSNYNRLYLFLKRQSTPYYSFEFLNVRNVYDKFYVGYPDNGGPLEGRQQTYTDGTSFPDTYEQGLSGEAILTLKELQLNAFPIGTTYSIIRSDTEDIAAVYLGEFEEVAGVITIPNCPIGPSTFFQIGVRYNNKIVTMPLEAGAQFGVAQGSARRSHEMSVFLDRSYGGQYTQLKANQLLDFTYETSQPSFDALYTGETRLSLNASPDDTQTLITQPKPLPFTVLWLLTKGYTYDA